MQDSSFEIEVLSPQTQPFFLTMIEANKFFGDDPSFYDRCFERQSLGELDIVLALMQEQCIGYGLLNWRPKYAYFKKLGLPEIQDLNVVSDYRRRGVGTALIKFCENMAIQKGYDEMGIGVGLDSSFASAQRLYVKGGYVPDGQGISYDRKQVTAGEFRPIDSNLCLMMTKKLK